MTQSDFLVLLRRSYEVNARTLPWRELDDNGTLDLYKVIVSEIMLQQTQVDRVVPKYQHFVAQYPTIEKLASASFEDVLRVWSGLGYNRRAKYLHDFAQKVSDITSIKTIEELLRYKGIGRNTAGAALVYTYNLPHIFIETNIRSVYLYYFFAGKRRVTDKQIEKVVEESIALLLTEKQPSFREFYWSIMDHGTYLKKQGIGNLQRSAHYKKQSVFAGSRRELRGKILRELLHSNQQAIAELKSKLQDSRIDSVLMELERDGLVVGKGSTVELT